ncbi:SpaH/EbpB family LPXTG-anchored major pilin [Alloiococcus sp. CFN-8]|uniref:SpaH/EbpB family LPXTG-anchored major pilin n=1 Tax=Alloiococcus sp. CFN-8 TaxID=3416081 RepID=UPI003CFACE14
MKKIKNFKRFLTALVCCCLLVTGFSFSAGATGNQEEKKPTIDNNKKGTLTLYKQKNVAGGGYNENNPVVEGAIFTAYKVASISSGGITSHIANKTFTGTTQVDSALITLVNANAENLRKYISTESSTEKGTYTFGEMELGIYLVVETQTPANYYATTDAFLVSIPQTNTSGDNWEYDIVARPKNNNITVDKSVTDANTKADSYSIGDVVPFIVQSTIPMYSKDTYTYNTNKERTGISTNATAIYYFTDTMSNGLTFLPNTVKVTAGSSVLIKDTDYIVTQEGAKITISLTNVALAVHAGKQIKVEYSATLNENAKITDGENNSVTLTFTTNPQTGDKVSTTPVITKVYTYQMDVTKTFENNPTVDLTKVLFTLKNSNGNSIFAKNINGVWTIDTRVSSIGNGFTDKLTLTKVGEEPNIQYKLIIKGLEAGTYTLTEIATIPGYNLLKAPINIEVDETKDDKGAVVSGIVKAKVDGKDIISETGSFTFTVNNTKGFELPQTGGMGTWMYTLGGLFIMAASAVLMLSMRKRRAVK